MKKLTGIFFVAVLVLAALGCGDKDKAIQRKIKVLEGESATALKNMNFPVAEEKFNQIIKLDPTSHPARNNLAVLYARYMNKPDEAVKLWEALIKETPKNSAYLNNLAGIYLTQKKFDQAIELYNQAKEFHRNYHLPFYNIGRIYIEQKKYPEAVLELKKGIELAENDSNMIATLSQALILNGQLDEAMTLLTKKYEENPAPLIVSMMYSKLNRRTGNLKRAMEIMDENMKFNPQMFFLLSERVEIAFAMGNTQEEIRKLISQVETTPDAPKYAVFFDLANSRLELRDGDMNKGIEQLEGLKGKIPGELIYLEGIRQFSLSQGYLKLDQKDKAEAALAVARELDPIIYQNAVLETETASESE